MAKQRKRTDPQENASPDQQADTVYRAERRSAAACSQRRASSTMNAPKPAQRSLPQRHGGKGP